MAFSWSNITKSWTGSHVFPSILNALSLKITGMAGAGYVQLPSQSSDPATPPTGIVRFFLNSLNTLMLKNESGVVSSVGTSSIPSFYASHTGTVLVTTSTGSLPPTVLGDFQLFTGIASTDRFVFERLVGGYFAGNSMNMATGTYVPQMYTNGTSFYINWNVIDCNQDYWRVRRVQ
jgi:hypothetical protein